MPKYIIRAPRYIDGRYIFASPDSPTEIEIPDGTKVDSRLFAVGSPEATEKLKPHFAPKEKQHVHSSEVHSKKRGEKSARPSDSEPI